MCHCEGFVEENSSVDEGLQHQCLVESLVMLVVGMLVGDEGGHADELIVSQLDDCTTLFIESIQMNRFARHVKDMLEVEP